VKEKGGIMENGSSRTAADVVAARAVSSLSPVDERVLFDPYAVNFLPAPWSKMRAFLQPDNKYSTSLVYRIGHVVADIVGSCRAVGMLVALRHRYIDDRLKRAYEKGIRQVVILGAGYDSRAHRLDYPGLRFIEIDHPETQRSKIEVLERQSNNLNKKVSYLSVDFLKDWAKQVEDSGAINAELSFIIWEGVSYYLSGSAVEYALGNIRRFCSPGSTLVFDSYPEEIAYENSTDPILRKIHGYGKRHGEPLRWGCDKERVPEFLEAHNYKPISVRTIEEIAQDLRDKEGLKITKAPVFAYVYIVEAEVE
jgi:methyltransferase (TIGR00027 family)